ncbi:type III-B CRISPR module RAMP protein Cmr1 [Thermodesulfobacteriota bacterium]
MRYQLELTPISLIWTGDYKKGNSRFLLTGLKGSLRWWYETLVRGLGGYACDPSDGGCELNFTNDEERNFSAKQILPEHKAAMLKAKICPACYLFGCTGWKSRFGLNPPVDENSTTMTGQLQQEALYTLKIVERLGYPLEAQEITLLKVLFSFISDHGSICAKNTLIPSEETGHPTEDKNLYGYQNGSRHGNFGLCTIALQNDSGIPSCHSSEISDFVASFTKNNASDNLEEWPNFKNVWYASQLINRLQLRDMVNRPPDKSNNYKKRPAYDTPATLTDKWHGGEQMKSKKIFAFHAADDMPTGAQPRSWGYVKSNNDGRVWLVSKWCWGANNLKWGLGYLQSKGVL